MAQRLSVEALVVYIFGSPSEPLALQVARWANGSPRFKAFAEGYRDKIRKKARGARGAEERGDLLFELQVAAWLLEERRFTVEYEKYLAEKLRGPDYTVTFRTRTPFNVEVKRLRAATEPGDESGVAASRVIRSVCEKLGQMPPGVVNVLALGVETASPDRDGLAHAMRLLLQRAEQKDEAFFARHGFAHSRDFFKQYLRLSAVVMRPVSDSTAAPAVLWLNPQARHPLPKEIAAILTA